MTRDNFKLPSVADFRRFGRFHCIKDLNIYHELPDEILCYVVPNYYFTKKWISRKVIENLRLHCINLKKQAEYEDFIQNLQDQKELMIRRLKDKIMSENVNSNC